MPVLGKEALRYHSTLALQIAKVFFSSVPFMVLSFASLVDPYTTLRLNTDKTQHY